VNPDESILSGVSVIDIYFYYPSEEIDGPIPEANGRFVPERPGNYVWTVKTCGLLQSAGYACKLTAVLPNEGVIITHREFLPDDLKPNRRQLIVCVVADMHRHPYAQVHVLQNPCDPLLRKPNQLWPAAYVPHWSETGLRARDPARGLTLQNVAYLGLPERLAPQLRSPRFAKLMLERGFQFTLVKRDQWYDYSKIDAVLAVRSLAALPFYKLPATKLYNAWLAGVPALLGHESAFQSERRSALDYFEVGSVQQIISTLERLRDDTKLRAAIEKNCAERAREVCNEQIARRWIALCDELAAAHYARWISEPPATMRRYFLRRKIAYTWFKTNDFLYRIAMMLRKQTSRLLT
jgi:hypothetical protein